MASALVFALTWAFASPDSPPYCSLFQQRSMRPAGIMELTLRATPDSVRDDHAPIGTEADPSYRARSVGDTAAVYAQVFDVVTAEGALGPFEPRRHPRVALVWWRLGGQCQRASPKPAVNRNVSELFLIARSLETVVPDTSWFNVVYTDLRPESRWIDGMPTFDVGDASWLYAPQYRRPVNLPTTIGGDLTVAEFRQYFAHLPATGTSFELAQASRLGLLRWGDSDPRRWTLYPAALGLCAAARNTGDTARSRGRCGP